MITRRFVGMRDCVEFVICKDTATKDCELPPFPDTAIILQWGELEQIDALAWYQLHYDALCKLQRDPQATVRWIGPELGTEWTFRYAGPVPNEVEYQQHRYLGIWKPYLEDIHIHNVFILLRKYDRDACVVLKADLPRPSLSIDQYIIEKVPVRFSHAFNGRWVNNVMLSGRELMCADLHYVARAILQLMNVPLYKMELYKFMIGNSRGIISGSNCTEMSQSLMTLFDIGVIPGESVWCEINHKCGSSEDSLRPSTSVGLGSPDVRKECVSASVKRMRGDDTGKGGGTMGAHCARHAWCELCN